MPGKRLGFDQATADFDNASARLFIKSADGRGKFVQAAIGCAPYVSMEYIKSRLGRRDKTLSRNVRGKIAFQTCAARFEELENNR